MTGTARCTNSRLRAGLSGPALIRQSSERLPLVMDEKAKLATLNIQCTVPGAGMLTLPRMLMYCNHTVTTCTSSTASTKEHRSESDAQ